MPVCTITDTLRAPSGAVLPQTTVIFRRETASVVAQDGDVVVPREVEATSDANGLISIELFAGRYVATVQAASGVVRFVVGVPDAETAVLSDLIDQFPEVTPTVLSQVQELRDEVIAAAAGVSGGGGGGGGTSDYTQLTNVPTAFPPEDHTHTVSDITDFPTLGTAAAQDASAFAAAVHTHLLAQIADAGTAAGAAITDFATAAQGDLADSAVQPNDLATVAVSGAYGDLSGLPNLGTAAATDATAYATAAQGGRADSAVQPGDLATVATSGAYADLSGRPTLGTAAATAVTDYATAAQGALADTALQPADMVGSVRTLWVDPAGDDAAEGNLPTAPLQTIGAAVAKADPGDIIRVRSGTYIETCPLILPRDVSVFGDGLRNVEVRPTEATKSLNMWLVDSGAYLWGMTFAGHQAGSFAVAFNGAADNTAIGATGPGAFIFKSPYIQNCSSYTAAQDAGLAGSTSAGFTGAGMEVDGDKCAPNSPIRSMVVDSYTQVNLGGLGCVVKNDAYAQLVSFFGTFCSTHVRAESGGQVNLSNSTTNFGTFGLVADGRSTTPIFSGTAAAAADEAQSITVGSMTASRIGPSSRPNAGMVFDVAGATYTVTGAVPNGAGWTVNFFPRLSGALAGGETVEFFNRSQISTGGHVMEFVGSGTNYNALPWFGGVPVPANEIVEVGAGRVFFSSTDQLGNFRVGRQFDVNGTTGSVTINTDQFNLSGLNAIGPFSRNGIEAAGVQLQEISNDVNLLASTGVADGNTAPTQFAVKAYLEARYTLTDDLAPVALSGSYGDLSGLPTLGTAAAQNVGAFATAAQGELADTATQPGDLATVATSGAYADLSGRPTLGTAASQNVGAFATAEQGALADSATQPGDLATVATSGAYADLSGKPALGTAAATDATAYATAAQGDLADTAVQPGDLAAVAVSGAYADLSGTPSLPAGSVVGTTDEQTLTNKTTEGLTLNSGYTEQVFVITDGATVNLDPNSGSVQTWTLGANRTPGQVNWATGQSITLMIDDGAARTIAWITLSVVWKTDGGNAPTLNTDSLTVIALWKIGATIYGARVGDA